MRYETIIDNISRDDWERYAKDFEDYSVYQTWPYQQVRAKNDCQEVSRAVVKDENSKVVAMCHVRIKYVKPLGLRVGYVQWGPLMLRKNCKLDCLTEAMNQLRVSYFGMKINVLRIVPNFRAYDSGRKVTEFFESTGFKKVPNVPLYHTFIVSLMESEDEIRRRIHRDCRRVLRKAERMEIEVRDGTSGEFFDTLEYLYAGAKKRKDFEGVDSQEFAMTQQMLAPKDKAIVLIAYYNGQPVTALATTHFGNTAVPILLASNETGLRCGTSYLLFWKAYLMAKHLGMEYYDLGGVDPSKNPKGYLFKKRMGGEEAFHIGTFEVCSNFRVKTTWRMAEKVYLKLKR